MKKIAFLLIVSSIAWNSYTKYQDDNLVYADEQQENLNDSEQLPAPSESDSVHAEQLPTFSEQLPASSESEPVHAEQLPTFNEPTVGVPSARGFNCDGRLYCSQMTSCEEATYFLQNCHGVKMDGEGDGVPCESQWCTNN